MDDSRSGISDRMDKISDYTGDAKDSAQSLTQKTTEWADTNLEKVNKSEAAIKAGVQDAKNALSQISNVSGSFKEEIKKINGILDTINGPEHQNEVRASKTP